jgi:hypothetical protein
MQKDGKCAKREGGPKLLDEEEGIWDRRGDSISNMLPNVAADSDSPPVCC